MRLFSLAPHMKADLQALSQRRMNGVLMPLTCKQTFRVYHSAASEGHEQSRINGRFLTLLKLFGHLTQKKIENEWSGKKEDSICFCPNECIFTTLKSIFSIPY